jgi:hypothetical protein
MEKSVVYMKINQTSSAQIFMANDVCNRISIKLFFAYCHFMRKEHIVEEREYFELLAVARSWIREI